MNYEPGLLVAGRYRLEGIIATGGMGQVWRATDETLERPVALKVLRPDTASDDGFLERFRAEARHSAALQHPNIATVHDFGEGAHSAYLVMELIDGKPLSEVIKERAPLPPEEVTEILFQAALALHAAHEAGVVHRDVKPANIVVDDDGYARLTDFGIARALAGAQLTQTGEVLGTPHYLSPEQAQGQPAGPLSDVYALAVVGYEMLTGRRPFAGDSMVTTALAHVSQPAPPLPETVPEPLRTTVMAALAKNPAQRPGSALAFSEALRLQVGDVPSHLRAGAASAVAPVLVGGAFNVGAPPSLPTSVMPAPAGTFVAGPQTPVNPTAFGPQGSSGVGLLWNRLLTSSDGTRRAWLVPVGTAVVMLAVLVVIVAMANRATAAQDATIVPTSAPSPTTTTSRTMTTPSVKTATTSSTKTAPSAPATTAASRTTPRSPLSAPDRQRDKTNDKSKGGPRK